MRLAVLTSHPIQYYAPLFRLLAQRFDLHVFFSHNATPAQQAAAGFESEFQWDVDLASGYAHTFLTNVAKSPNPSSFFGCDTPEISERLREGRFDAVLSIGWHLKSLLQGVWAAKRMRLPVLVRGDSHLGTPRSAIKNVLKEIAYPPFLQMFDAALYVGERNRAYYEHYHYPSKRLFGSPHCVDTERFAGGATIPLREAFRSQLGVSSEERLVLFVGKLMPLKRPLDVVEAVAALRNKQSSVRIVIAGSGELETALRERAAALGIPIHLLGFQNQSRMPSILAAADALVLCSGEETWGLVCNEALACGTPIVVSDAVGCAPDLAADGHVGRTFPVGNVTACANALAALFSAPPSRVEIEAVSARFTLAAAADGVVEALAAVAAKGAVRNASAAGLRNSKACATSETPAPGLTSGHIDETGNA